MKSILLYIFCGFILLGAFSCQTEDELMPDPAQPNLFAPKDDATDPISVMRRDFYKETGCYLLFSDTLKNTPNGTDAYGNQLYDRELLDLTYGINSSVRWKFRFYYINGYEAQLAAAQTLKDKLLPAISPRYYPYSFLLVKDMESYAWQVEEGEEEGVWTGPYEMPYYIGVRAMAVSIDQLEDDPEGTILQLSRELINKYLATTDMTEFEAPGKKYYGIFNTPLYELNFDSVEDFVRQTGILSYYYDEEYEELSVDSKQDDINAYLNAILGQSEEDFRSEHEGEVIVLKKYDFLRNLLIKGGFNVHN